MEEIEALYGRPLKEACCNLEIGEKKKYLVEIRIQIENLQVITYVDNAGKSTLKRLLRKFGVSRCASDFNKSYTRQDIQNYFTAFLKYIYNFILSDTGGLLIKMEGGPVCKIEMQVWVRSL
jgi:hypothetical protein